MEKRHNKKRPQAASPVTPTPSEPQAPDPVPAKADVYDPVGMAGQKAGVVEKLEQQQADGEHQLADEQTRGRPAQAPDKANVYNPVGMAGQKAGMLEEVDKQQEVPAQGEARTKQ